MSKKGKNYRYNRRIRRLCYRLLKGDANAAELLKVELSNNPQARKVVKAVINSAKNSRKKREARIRCSLGGGSISTYNYPCQGGSPGLGRRA